MTMTFVSLVLIQFFKAYSFRSDRHSVLIRPFANKWLNLAIIWELLLLVLIVGCLTEQPNLSYPQFCSQAGQCRWAQELKPCPAQNLH
jgi:hypothetical protein